jgi:hypothetical protein
VISSALAQLAVANASARGRPSVARNYSLCAVPFIEDSEHRLNNSVEREYQLCHAKLKWPLLASEVPAKALNVARPLTYPSSSEWPRESPFKSI